MDGHQANGAFVAVGPPGFTALALINLGKQAQVMFVLSMIMSHSVTEYISVFSLPAHNLVSPNAGEIWYASSILGATALLGLAVFLFLFGALPWWFRVHKHLNEILGCWALTFPNGEHLALTRHCIITHLIFFQWVGLQLSELTAMFSTSNSSSLFT